MGRWEKAILDLIGEMGNLTFEETADGGSRRALILGLLGPRTLPSFEYSHTRPRCLQRAQGRSPLHCCTK